MKATIIVLFILLLFITSVDIFAATGNVKIYKKVGKTEGTRWWNGDVTYPCPLEGGSDCKVTIKEKSNCNIINVGDGFLLTITIDEIDFINLSNQEVISVQVANSYLYNGEFELRIEDCNEFPSLVGITVDIPTTVINQEKKFQVFIPLI